MKPRQIAVQFLLVVLLFSLGAALTFLPRLYKDRNRLNRNLKSGLPLSEENILEVLAGIDDPELDIGIVDLGLIRAIEIEKEDTVSVTIIFTSPFCPLSDYFISQIKRSIKSMEGVRRVEVSVDRSVRWTQDMMSEAGKEKLRGIFQ